MCLLALLGVPLALWFSDVIEDLLAVHYLVAIWVSFLVYAVFLIAAAFLLFRRAVYRHLTEAVVECRYPLCVHCGYDLQGLAEPRCPECGATFDTRLLTSSQETHAAHGQTKRSDRRDPRDSSTHDASNDASTP